ncbi:hypothetical protein ACHAAC_09275 [Aeromicrobium sp. CF4.19]|uniref:hypothetical protein n=1 Tax=Aeromicrobium sp. CF4.19 TaxID=3373082 RepID=UPI003EE44A5A
MAYEERHGLESWKDKQPKAKDLSDVVEAMSARGARRDPARRRSSSDPRRVHTPNDCLNTVGEDLTLMTMIVEQVIDITRRYGVINTFEGRQLAERVAELASAVLARSARVVPVDVCRGINPSNLEEGVASLRGSTCRDW